MIRILHSTAKNPELKELTVEKTGSWIHLEEPKREELRALAKKHNLNANLLIDGIDPNESPRIERDAGSTYIFTRYCLPEEERLTTAPLLIVYTEDFVITVCRRPFNGMRTLTENGTPIYTSKRAQLVLALLSEVNLGFKERITLVSRRIWQMRSRLNRAHIDNREFLMILDLEEDLNDILWTLEPMRAVLNTLLNGRFIRLYEEDRDLIEDLSLSAQELAQLAASRLNAVRNIRDAYSAIATNNLNKIFRMLTSVAILIAIATMVTSFYGMNVQLPFAEDANVFWLILTSILLGIAVVAFIFRRKNWL